MGRVARTGNRDEMRETGKSKKQKQKQGGLKEGEGIRGVDGRWVPDGRFHGRFREGTGGVYKRPQIDIHHNYFQRASLKISASPYNYNNFPRFPSAPFSRARLLMLAWMLDRNSRRRIGYHSGYIKVLSIRVRARLVFSMGFSVFAISIPRLRAQGPRRGRGRFTSRA